MDKINQLSNFIEEIFDLYHLNKLGFFFESDDETFEEYSIPLFPGEKIDDEIIKRLSIKLGLDPFEILSMDESVMYKYWNKYHNQYNTDNHRSCIPLSYLVCNYSFDK